MEVISEKEILDYLKRFGKVDIIKPIKDRQGKVLAKDSYFLSLFMNSSVNDDKFIDFCKSNNVIVQFDLYS